MMQSLQTITPATGSELETTTMNEIMKLLISQGTGGILPGKVNATEPAKQEAFVFLYFLRQNHFSIISTELFVK